MHKLFLTLFSFLLIGVLSAQTSSSFFTKIEKETIPLAEDANWKALPTRYEAYEIDLDALKRELVNAPKERSAEAKSKPLVLFFPNANGHMEPFRVVESSIMTPDFQARWPEMRQYIGYSMENTAKSMRFNYSPIGFYATMVRPDKVVEYIEPVANGQTQYYMNYSTRDIPMEHRSNDMLCGAENGINPILPLEAYGAASSRSNVGDTVMLREYRFIVSTTGEFAQDHGGTVQSVLSAIMNYVSSFNAIIEPELALRLIVIAETEDVIFLDPLSAPWSGTDVGGWMAANPGVIAQYSPGAQYDLGHNFARYFAGTAIGVAGGRACNSNINGGHKARGCTAGRQGIYGNGFIETAVHEVGHQCSAGHSWNNCPPSAQQFAAASACEPGSGSTLMSYQGSCGGDNNISGPGGAYYNICNIQEQLRPFVHEGSGSTCGVSVASDNRFPEVSTTYPAGLTIPKSTPFELDATATDADGDDLVFCWEGIDRGPQRTLGSPEGTSPLFRSFAPRTASNRIFPRLSTILSNSTDREEVLPDYTRDVTMVISVRDNKMGGGGVSTAMVELKAVASAGPFLVESPNTAADVWTAGTCVPVRWDVANTDGPAVNCQSINVRLSLDGGLSFPIALAEDVPNSGLTYVTIPNVTSSNARIKVEAADNVFFDLSNANFSIEMPTTPDFSLCSSNASERICLPAIYTTDISSIGISGFTEDVALSVTGLPTGAVATFSDDMLTVGSTSTLSIDMTEVFENGTFTIQVTGTSTTGGAKTLDFTLVLTDTDYSSVSLMTPADGAVGIGQSPMMTFSGAANAEAYEFQVSTTPSFDTIVVERLNQTNLDFQLPFLLDKASVYYWRVRAKNKCRVGEWIGPNAFSTVSENCSSFEANDLPKVISASIANVESQINVIAGGEISDLNIRKVKGNHQFFKDITLSLRGPDGTEVILVSDVCPQNVAFDFGFDDNSPSVFPCPPPATGLPYQPQEALSVFNGKDAQGEWKLILTDSTFQGGGNLTEFELEICASGSLNPPVLINNNPLTIDPGKNDVITTAMLLSEDIDNTADELIYTLVRTPQWGHIAKSWVQLEVGDQWTQSDIDNGLIRFFDYGNTSVPSDNFTFTVVDGEGGFVGTPSFTIIHSTVSADDVMVQEFSMMPNPASDAVRINLDNPLTTKTQMTLLNVAGQQIQNHTISVGQVAFDFSVSDLAQGMYFVVLHNEFGRTVRRLAVQ